MEDKIMAEMSATIERIVEQNNAPFAELSKRLRAELDRLKEIENITCPETKAREVAKVREGLQSWGYLDENGKLSKTYGG